MKIKLFAIITLISLLLVSCGSTPTNEGEKPAVKSPEPKVEDTVIEVVEDEPEVEDVVEDVIDNVVSVEEDEEYLRSVNDISDVSKEEFNEDKAAILKIIDELSVAMKNYDFEKIKTYVAPESVEYHSNIANLKQIQKKLPNKQIQLKGIKDYFRYVFIPARQDRTIDEIRYESKTSVKAVEFNKEENKSTVFYHFVKQNGKWLVYIPEV